MNDSAHSTSAQSARIEPSDLPDGWRSAELEVWKDPYLAAHRRLRAVQVALVVLVLACVVGVLLWTAAIHYARGVDALKVHSYSTAVSEFSVARVLVFPYRDARSLEDQARSALVAEDARYEQAAAREAAVVAQLAQAGVRLGAGDAAGVLAALQGIGADDLRAMLVTSQPARESADALAQELTAASRRALGNAAWVRAGSFAAALLVLEPSSQLAVALGAKARTGEDLSAKLGKAKDAARRGEWRVALRLALAVLAVKNDFPGAVAVVADARDALAPKPKSKPAATTAAPPAPATTITTPARPPTPPQPPPP